ncbi:MAG: GNAT family N-acetyltransferase [Planctomycetota bacterium]
MSALSAPTLRRLDRLAVQRHLTQLSSWLLPGSIYDVQHTWPQLYRSDGAGHFYGLFIEDRLLSHCAFRSVALHTKNGAFRIALLGSVATDPQERGRGHASQLLQNAIADCQTLGVDGVLLWAERPLLYARHGFIDGGQERCLVIAGGNAFDPNVRRATIEDHAALCALHAQKPVGVARDLRTMSCLLSTPGMATFVLMRGDRVVAYACIGKGADLQNWWHELGGSDCDVAALLPAAMSQMQQSEGFLLVPPYRETLAQLLAPITRSQNTVAGPMLLSFTAALHTPVWIDGLDSV